MAAQGPTKKVAHSLVAMSSAAVFAVYGAGYTRTRAAADKFAAHAAERRPHIPVARDATTPVARERSAPLATAPVTAVKASPRPASSRAESLLALAAPAPSIPETHATQPAPAAKPAAAVRVEPRATRADDSPAASAASPIATVPETSAAPSADTTPVAAPPAPVPSVDAPSDAAATARFRDGTYLGWGTSRHGDIQAAVVIEGGRITAARVAQCLTRYSCSWIAPIPPVIIQRQGTTYDYVSGATESSDAFQEAIADALSHAL